MFLKENFLPRDFFPFGVGSLLKGVKEFCQLSSQVVSPYILICFEGYLRQL